MTQKTLYRKCKFFCHIVQFYIDSPCPVKLYILFLYCVLFVKGTKRYLFCDFQIYFLKIKDIYTVQTGCNSSTHYHFSFTGTTASVIIPKYSNLKKVILGSRGLLDVYDMNNTKI